MHPALPHANTYRVPGTRLVAGEYPFTEHPDSARLKLGDFVRSGITCFVDLTEEGELHAYALALGELARAEGLPIDYHRLPIRDMGIPDRGRMCSILDMIDRVEAQGGTPYVHCWGGVGRTGTVVGCYLVRRGIAPDAALKQVAALFETMSPEKVRRHPEGSPQTEPQRNFVRSWFEAHSQEETVVPVPPAA